MAVVCDGMGGLKNGEVASSEVARFFLNGSRKHLNK